MFDNMSDDDSQSTQLEGKKLKKRGAYMEGQLLEIEKDSPALMEEQEIEAGQEYFTDRELGKENEEERGERLKREMAAARQQQLELQKQQQQQRLAQRIDDPNLKLDEIQQGIMQSQNKGQKTIKNQFNMLKNGEKPQESEHLSKDEKPLKKTDMAVAHVLLGDNDKNLNFSDDIKLAEKAKTSIPATRVQDVRDKSQEHMI